MTDETSSDQTSTSSARTRVKPPGDAFPTATIDLDERVPAIHVWRDFHAPPAQVMNAHTDPDLFARWIGPEGLTTRIHTWDCRTLGSYRYTQLEGEEEYSFRGTFPEVSEHRIVQTFCFEPWPDSVLLETMTFSDPGDGRTRLHAFTLCPSFEDRDGLVVSGMEVGIQQGYACLDSLLAAASE